MIAIAQHALAHSVRWQCHHDKRSSPGRPRRLLVFEGWHAEEVGAAAPWNGGAQ
jgi:hypothetical protein